MVERFERFSFAISEISRYWHKLATEEMEKHGLKGTHSVYLITMLKFPDGITAPKLSELCSKDKSDVSRMMAIMEERGFVKKEGVHQNCYRGVFKLTEKGIKAADQLKSRVALAVELAGRDLSIEEREVFYKSLESISGNLRVLSKEGLPEN